MDPHLILGRAVECIVPSRMQKEMLEPRILRAGTVLLNEDFGKL